MWFKVMGFRFKPLTTLMFSDQLFSDFFQNLVCSGTAICVGCLLIKYPVVVGSTSNGTPTVLDDLLQTSHSSPPHQAAQVCHSNFLTPAISGSDGLRVDSNAHAHR